MDKRNLIQDEEAADWMLSEDDSKDYSQQVADVKAKISKMTAEEKEAYYRKANEELETFIEKLKNDVATR